MRSFLLPSLLLLTACGSSTESSTIGFSGDPTYSGGTTGGNGTGTGGSAGVLTAGVWDDNLNYGFFQSYLGLHAALDGKPTLSSAAIDASHSLFAQRVGKQVVDLALVVDTTGSMGDEIAYLRAEFEAITGAIQQQFPSAQQRWAIVAYRDENQGDVYTVQAHDFSPDMTLVKSELAPLDAAGGGDYPESPDLGIQAADGLGWRTGDSVARVMFWIADAPHHVQNAGRMTAALTSAQQAGVHIYPISASGTDDLLEYTMRSAAQLTGGRYLFLTNDSGVGDPHKEPEIPCYFVTKLDRALVRVVSMELSGQYIAPDPADVIRAGGDPKNGACATADGGQVSVF